LRDGKQQFLVAKNGASSKRNSRSDNSKSEKANDGERKTVRRTKVFKSDDWYEKAASSMAIGTKS
jgi:hypothetical protein